MKFRGTIQGRQLLTTCNSETISLSEMGLLYVVGSFTIKINVVRVIVCFIKLVKLVSFTTLSEGQELNHKNIILNFVG